MQYHKQTKTAGQDAQHLQHYYHYLRKEGLAESTATEHVKNLERFLQWAKQNELLSSEWQRETAQLNYRELLEYVHHLKTKKLSVPTQNIRLGSIRRYYEYLKATGQAENNPARGLHIKGAVKKVVYNPLSYETLEKLYNDYEQYIEAKPIREAKQVLTKQKSIVVSGLMIWQGIHSGELKKIETRHINLKQGSIYIPGTARSNSRELKLETIQVLPLNNYLHSLPESRVYLVSDNTHNLVARITGELKGLNQSISNAGHIRASVILHWLRMYNKRQVQYMIGHKWISSTEHYEVQELEGLTGLLEKHHPFS